MCEDQRTLGVSSLLQQRGTWQVTQVLRLAPNALPSKPSLLLLFSIFKIGSSYKALANVVLAYVAGPQSSQTLGNFSLSCYFF